MSSRMIRTDELGRAERRELKAARRRHPTSRTRHRAPSSQFYVLALVVAALTLLGLVMVFSASFAQTLRSGGSPWLYVRKQGLWAVIGAVVLVVAYRVPYGVWRRFTVWALGVSFLLMLAPFVPGLGREANGALAWVQVGPIGFQPGEVAKLALLLYAADLFTQRADRVNEVRSTLVPLLGVTAVFEALLLAQGDFGGAAVLLVIVLAVAFIGGTPLTPLSTAVLGGATVAAMFVLSTPYRRERWLAFLDLARYSRDEGYQVTQSLVGIASGGVTGLGIGASRAKWGFLPEAHTDFIFAIIAEEMGLVGAATVCLLFAAVGLTGAMVALRCTNRFGMLLAGGITAWIVVQAAVNIGGVTGLLPLTGLTLPFVSFGGSSLVVMLAAAGLLLNVARTSR